MRQHLEAPTITTVANGNVNDLRWSAKEQRAIVEINVFAGRAIPIDRVGCRDLADKDGFELTVKSGGKERIFTISDAQSVKDPEAEIELLINRIGDNE